MRVKSTAPELALEAVSAQLSIAVRPPLSLYLTRYQCCPAGLSLSCTHEHIFLSVLLGLRLCQLLYGTALSSALCTASRAVSWLLS